MSCRSFVSKYTFPLALAGAVVRVSMSNVRRKRATYSAVMGRITGPRFFNNPDRTRARPRASIFVGSASRPSCRRGSLIESCFCRQRCCADLKPGPPTPSVGRVAVVYAGAGLAFAILIPPALDPLWVGTRSASSPAHDLFRCYLRITTFEKGGYDHDELSLHALAVACRWFGLARRTSGGAHDKRARSTRDPPRERGRQMTFRAVLTPTVARLGKFLRIQFCAAVRLSAPGGSSRGQPARRDPGLRAWGRRLRGIRRGRLRRPVCAHPLGGCGCIRPTSACC